MNKKTKSKRSAKANGRSVRQGSGPGLTEFLRRLRPPEEARRHFEAARLEILKGLRALLDARIERRSQSKGKKISVE